MQNHWAPRGLARAAGLAAALAVSWIVGLAGCGTSDYERLFQQRGTELKRTGPFHELKSEATDIPGAGARFRAPKILNVEPHDPKAKDIKPRRLRPSALATLRGHRLTFEAKVSGKGVESPIYLYVCGGALGADKEVKNHVAYFTNGLKQGAADATIEEPAEVDCPTPHDAASGKPTSLHWTRVAATNVVQEIDEQLSNSDDFSSQPVTMEIWIHLNADKKRAVYLVWSVPDKIRAALPKFADLAKATAGTLEVD